MTREELVKMTGSEEQADYALELVLKQVTQSFVTSCVKAEENALEAQIKAELEAGYIWKNNGSYAVSWSKAMELNGWNLTEEQQRAYDEASDRCSYCDVLLYRLNRTVSLRAIRG